jgi:uncharacterized protein with HEPN domain
VSDPDREPLLDALEPLDVMTAHLARGSLDDPLSFDAVCQRLASAIESLSRLRSKRRQELFGDEWHAIWATRYRIAHAYLRINPVTIRATVERNIPMLVDTLRQSLAELPNGPAPPTQDED